MKKTKRTKPTKAMPVFESLRSESDFWDSENPLEYGNWEEISYDEILKDLKRDGRRKRQISLRLEPDLIEALKSVAREHGIPYQKLAREILRRSIDSLSRQR